MNHKNKRSIKITFYRNENGTFFIKSRDYEKLYNSQNKSVLITWILEKYKNKKENI